ncbi:hypothetical protein [Alteromonas lipolytica]|nr:hypothetical protein [Alteromonas lipolytica]GGF54510.1 hypothetical protein GCM10011338_03390 [Alteromonas lipolytica]
MSNTKQNEQTLPSSPGIFNWFARYEESAHPSQYQVNLPSSRDSQEE